MQIDIIDEDGSTRLVQTEIHTETHLNVPTSRQHLIEAIAQLAMNPEETQIEFEAAIYTADETGIKVMVGQASFNIPWRHVFGMIEVAQ